MGFGHGNKGLPMCKVNGRRIVVQAADVMDGTMGVCLRCGEEAYGVEPDANGYRCESCGEPSVYGLEEAVIMGVVDVDDEG